MAKKKEAAKPKAKKVKPLEDDDSEAQHYFCVACQAMLPEECVCEEDDDESFEDE